MKLPRRDADAGDDKALHGLVINVTMTQFPSARRIYPLRLCLRILPTSWSFVTLKPLLTHARVFISLDFALIVLICVVKQKPLKLTINPFTAAGVLRLKIRWVGRTESAKTN